MILKPLQQIVEADIQALLDNEVSEGRSLDYTNSHCQEIVITIKKSFLQMCLPLQTLQVVT